MIIISENRKVEVQHSLTASMFTQCSSQAIFQLVNINDLNQVKDVVEGVGEAEIN